MNKKNVLFAFAIILIGAFIFSSCNGVITISAGPSGIEELYTFDSLASSKELKTLQFKSETEVSKFLQLYSNQNYYGYYELENDILFTRFESISSDSAMAVPQDSTTKAGSADYSETNVQVAGVDEADIIKTDGEYIYTISNSVLYIIKAYPGAEAEVVSKLKFNNTPSGLFIKEDHLAIFGNFGWNDPVIRTMDFYVPNQKFSFLEIYDISDKANPKLLKDYKFDGSYFNSRMSDDFIYLVTIKYPSYKNERPIPVYYDGSIKREIDVSNVYYYPIPYKNPMFATISSINIIEPFEEINSKSFLVEGSQNMYMSKENIYITYSEYINENELRENVMIDLLENRLNEEQKKYIEKVKATDGDVLLPSEKRAKILQVYFEYIYSLDSKDQEAIEDELETKLEEKLEEFEAFEFTVINKISVDNAKITPVANNKVPGSIVNQFSMDEYDETFRIATTLNPRWSVYDKSRKVSTNQIYTLDKDLKVLDRLEGLAEDERIYSTRFIGDKLYMVTFKQIDPFFVIDLSNPKDIKELGQLKIPGFSKYLHPYDESTIIGIGKDATETGRTKGLKISLFDVSDVSNPKEIASYISEERYAESTALYEHKAFLFSKEKNLLVIPSYNYNYQETSENYNGALVFDIQKDSITLRGLIDHSQGVDRYYQPTVERSLYIEDLLYTKSLGLLRINALDDLSSVNNVTLQYKNENIKIY